ncbi:hypothetical protein EYC84_010471 [Monilinia fructicola]|uniref:Uncharacterized protein n=1 Tax=Monilinia fructicola TaxID=38448 RepID=A0A5M9JHM0_MONFR|nr:hypothetical protein EYC84_010471 [Monilinia fructicola]
MSFIIGITAYSFSLFFDEKFVIDSIKVRIIAISIQKARFLPVPTLINPGQYNVQIYYEIEMQPHYELTRST